MNSKTSPYALLKNKNILAILDGDTPMGTYLFSDGQTIEVRMPYLSGPNLCDISNQFGLPVSYNRDATLSRWQYLDNLMDYCIEQDMKALCGHERLAKMAGIRLNCLNN